MRYVFRWPWTRSSSVTASLTRISPIWTAICREAASAFGTTTNKRPPGDSQPLTRRRNELARGLDDGQVLISIGNQLRRITGVAAHFERLAGRQARVEGTHDVAPQNRVE